MQIRHIRETLSLTFLRTFWAAFLKLIYSKTRAPPDCRAVTNPLAERIFFSGEPGSEKTEPAGTRSGAPTSKGFCFEEKESLGKKRSSFSLLRMSAAKSRDELHVARLGVGWWGFAPGRWCRRSWRCDPPKPSSQAPPERTELVVLGTQLFPTSQWFLFKGTSNRKPPKPWLSCRCSLTPILG